MRASTHRTHRSPRRLIALVAGASLFATVIPPAVASAADPDDLALAEGQPVATSSDEAAKSRSSALAETPDELLSITSSEPVPVIIKLDYDAVASYAGGIEGLEPTSPAVTGEKLSEPTPAVEAYEEYVAEQEAEITAEIEATVSEIEFGASLRTVYGGVVAYVPGNEIPDLLEVPGVVAVQENTLNQLLTDSSIDFINAPAAYDVLGTDRYAGAGVVYANLDSGVWPEHPSFADDGTQPAYTGPPIPCEFGDNPLTEEIDPFECNNKLIGGRHFTDSYDLIAANGGATPDLYPGTARDGNGHGSHTASTSAGAGIDGVQTLGPLVDHIQGVAPGAHIIEYKVCGPDGCTTADTAAAVQQAIIDGADVINFSISGGSNPLTDATELAFLDAYAAGVFVAASAGNDGPDAGSANHVSPWVTTVAASTQAREFASTLTVIADNGDTFTASGASITAGVDEPLPLVRASDHGDPLCQQPAEPGQFVGVIVVCERGVNARVEKSYNVSLGGAAGMILYNPTLADIVTDNHFVPTVHLADGTDFVAFLASHSGEVATFTAAAAGDGQPDVIAAFSSRGPAGPFLKPDITAPGVQILAAHTPTPDEIAGGPPGQSYQAIAGTSMSSPHIAGVAILLKAIHPDWDPGQIKSAIMTQALGDVVKEDLVTPADPFDMGAGRVDVGAALGAPLTISDTAVNMFSLTADPIHAIDLNIPSINAPILPGRIVTTRTLRNVTGATLTVTPSADVPAGTTVTFEPATLTIPAGGTGEVEITITSQAPEGVQQFGSITFATNAGSARIPVAFVHTQGNVTLAQYCEATEIEVGDTTECTVTAVNNSFDTQEVTITSTGTGAVSADATETATLAGAELGVPSFGDGASPAGGFLPLAPFGIGTVPVGDETILNFNVPPFVFNGQTYTAIGVTSNGYAVAGGGTGSDVEWDPPAGPSPAAPNNVLAPFWTDLNGDEAPGIRIAVLTDGTNDWLVIEWELAVWGTDDIRHFQTWIGVNGVQDISYVYARDQDDPGQNYLVGAENAAGQGDMRQILPARGDELAVSSTDPSPGDSVTMTVTVTGTSVGDGALHSELVAPRVPGVTTVDTPITVVEGPPPAPPWDPNTVYDTGDEVWYEGAVYVAQWWTRNQVPGASPWGPWAEVGAEVECASGTYLAWTDSWIYTGGETVVHGGQLFTAKWWTRNQVPGDPWGPWQPLGNC